MAGQVVSQEQLRRDHSWQIADDWSPGTPISDGLPGDRKALHTKGSHIIRAHSDLSREPQGWKSAYQGGQRDSHLDSGQLLTEALMDATSETQVSGRVAGVRLGEVSCFLDYIAREMVVVVERWHSS